MMEEDMAVPGLADSALERFDREAGRSHTLPGRYYFDPEIYEREKEAIFYRRWQYASHVSQLSQPGDYITQDVADESVIVLRDDAGGLRGFFNVCQHRAHRLLEGAGRLKHGITCPYHAWGSGLDGALRAAPHGSATKDFHKANFCLSPVRVETLCGFVYFNSDPDAAPLATGLEDFERQFLSFGAAPETLVRAYHKEIDVKANWKNVIENYDECYHCLPSHPTLMAAVLDLNSYRIDVHDAYHVHTSGNRGESQGYSFSPDDGPRAGDFASWLIWPNTVFEYFPGGKLTVFHNAPIGPERTLQTIEWYLPQATPTDAEREIIDFVDAVRLEDIPLVESVQRGLHSRGYGQGRFMVDDDCAGLSEHAVHDFQRKVLNALGLERGRNA
jgi:phenylpropionate dioxygenase-like ring-hydroxylating dioxygenase large terminal subunit